MLTRITAMAALFGLLAGNAFAQGTTMQTPEDYIAYADSNYSNNSLLADDRKKVSEELQQAADKWKDNYQLQWRAAQAIFAYGDMVYSQYQVENFDAAEAANKIKKVKDVFGYSQALNKAQSKFLLQNAIVGRAFADRAVNVKPDGAEGHYFNALLISQYAFGKSIVTALLEGLGPKYEDHLKKVIAADNTYLSGAPYAAYGRYYYKLPWPKRSLKRSLEMLKEAEALGPDNINTLLFIGDTYYDQGKTEDAIRSWEKCRDSSFMIYHHALIKKLAEARLKYAAKK